MSLPAAASSLPVFLGTYTKSGGRGIYRVTFDGRTGALGQPEAAADSANPTFLALHPHGEVLYSIRELGTVDGKPGGAVSAYRIDRATGRLTLLNEQVSGGIGLTHLAADATGRTLIAVSYSGGYVVAFPLAPDGRIGERSTFIAHRGPLGPNASRQRQSHAHSVTLSPDNRFAFVADLGMDRVFSYRLDAARSTLTPNDPPFIAITPGAGPRHSKFSPDGRHFYVLNEIDGSVTACTYDAADGSGIPIQHISTLPAGFVVEDADRAAEIRIHPSGKFLYASNRGHDSIAVFAVDLASGRLTLVEIAPAGGKAPRNFNLAPDGAWLLCAHQDSNTLVAFRVDAATGRLSRVGAAVEVPMPVCVLFAV
ncbi:MAG TPA: lactonase family protein [Opitutaceae bacterium]|nr:lactonase family protein [Opitutaceae bacterium]